MTVQELKTLVQQGEGAHIEFKQSIPSKVSDLADEVCAFANTEGGTIFIGVSDKGQIQGIEVTNVIRSRLQDVMKTIKPIPEIKMTEIQLDNGKAVLCIHCESGNNKPYFVSGQVFIRRGANSEKLMTQEEVFNFFRSCDVLFFDNKPCDSFSFQDDFDQEWFKKFLSITGISDVLQPETILRNLELIDKSNNYKSAVVLLFAKNLQRHYFHAETRCLLFKGTSKYKILDDKTYGGNLVQQYDQAYNYILSKLNLNYIIEGFGPRKEVLEIPETVFKEALINALCHRDYYERGATIMVEIYDDRVEITNPGGLVNSIKKEEFGRKSFSRNPLVFSMFQRMNMVEKVGSGIKRMRDEMSAAGLPSPEFSFGGMFTAIFYRPINFETWLNKWKPILAASQIQILEEIHTNNHMTKSKLAEVIGISSTGLDKNLNKLKQLGILIHEGSKRAGVWKIIKKPMGE